MEVKTPLHKRPQGTRHRFPGGREGADGYGAREKVTAPQDETQNVVVYLVQAPAGPVPAGPHPKMVQKGREFIPFVLPVVAGTTVDFPNQDTIYHSVYSDSEPKHFHLEEYPQGQSRQVTFDHPGIVELYCAIHSHMNAYILVLQNRFFAQVGPDHRYRLEGVPPGRYVLKAWHPLLEPVTQIVEVKGSGTTRADFTL